MQGRFVATSTAVARWYIFDTDDYSFVNEKPLIWKADAEYAARELNHAADVKPDAFPAILNIVKDKTAKGVIDDVVPVAILEQWFLSQSSEYRRELNQRVEEEFEESGQSTPRFVIQRRLIQAAMQGAVKTEK